MFVSSQTFTEHLSCTGTELGPGGHTETHKQVVGRTPAGLSCLQVEKQSAVDVWGGRCRTEGAVHARAQGPAMRHRRRAPADTTFAVCPRPCGLGAPRGDCHPGYQAVVSGAALECSKMAVGVASMPRGLLEVTDC